MTKTKQEAIRERNDRLTEAEIRVRAAVEVSLSEIEQGNLEVGLGETEAKETARAFVFQIVSDRLKELGLGNRVSRW